MWRQWATHESSTMACLSSLPWVAPTSCWVAHPKRWKATLCNLPKRYWWNLLRAGLHQWVKTWPTTLGLMSYPSCYLNQNRSLSESQLDAFHPTGSCSIKHREAFWSSVSPLVLPWPPLPTTGSPKAHWLKRAQLNQHMLRPVMTPMPLLLLVYQCSLVLPSIFCRP